MKKQNHTKKHVLYLAQAGLIAALYVVLTALANALGLANYPIQLRFSEALCVLPMFTPAAIPGLFVGCLIANLAGGCIWQDVVFGSLATLAGAVGTYLIGKMLASGSRPEGRPRLGAILAGLPAVLANTLIMPPILKFAYGFPGSVWYFYLTVCAGELLSAWALGAVVYAALYKRRDKIFIG